MLPTSVAAFLARPLVKALAGPSLIVGLYVAGWGSGMAWEHRPEMRGVLGLLGPSLAVQRDAIKDSIPRLEAAAREDGHRRGAQAQADRDRPAFQRFEARVQQCDAARRSERDQAAEMISRAEARSIDQASSAYRLGRATCEAPHAIPDPGPGGSLGLVPDDRPATPSFRDLFSAGAYSPG